MGSHPRPFELLIAISVLKNDTTILLFDTKNEFNVFSVSKIDTEKTQKKEKKDMKQCPVCKTEIQDDVTLCPLCHTRVTSPITAQQIFYKKSFKWSDISIILGFCASILGCFNASFLLFPLSLITSIIGFQGNSTRKLAISQH